MKRILYLLTLLFSLTAASQNVTIDYQAWNPSGTTCSLFVNATNVPATGTTSGTIEHQRKLGETVYNSSDQSLQIRTEYQTTGGVLRGGRYRIAYTFKAGYSYIVYITAAAAENTVGNNTGPYIRADINSNGGGGSTGCNGPETINANAGGSPAAVKLSSNAFQEFQLVFPQMGNQSTLEISAFPETNGGTKTVRIRKIRIVETAPATSFTLTPSSANISCGSTTPITFTATGSNIPSGATVSYSWNFGTGSNGWLYNGNPAPQTISTGTTNTLTLTPVCGATQSSVSATATVNSTNYITNASAVSVIAPSLTIQGSTSFCSGTSVYNLVGTIPCNAAVSWTASPAGIVSLSPSGSSATATQVGDGIATLTATINACNNFAVSQFIAVGMPDRPKVLDEMGEEVTTVSACTGNYISLCPTIDSKWNILQWEWEKGVGNFDLLAYESCAQVLGFQPGNGFVSVRVRNACGWSNPTLIVVYVNDCSGMRTQQKSVKLFPNPATNSVTLSVDKQMTIQPKGKENVPVASINEVKVYDNFGSVKIYRKFTKQPTATLDVSRLSKGIYMLEVNTGSGVEHHQLIIQR